MISCDYITNFLWLEVGVDPIFVCMHVKGKTFKKKQSFTNISFNSPTQKLTLDVLPYGNQSLHRFLQGHLLVDSGPYNGLMVKKRAKVGIKPRTYQIMGENSTSSMIRLLTDGGTPFVAAW